jgi:hypothetical protein
MPEEALMSRINTLTLAACGVALALLSPLASGADADGQACRHRAYVDPQLSSELTGVYGLSNGELLRVSREVNRFAAEMPSTGRIEIVPVEQDVFVERNGPVRLVFEREAFVTEVVVTGLDGQASGAPVCRR